MARQLIQLGTISIANGGTTSTLGGYTQGVGVAAIAGAIVSKLAFGELIDLTIFGPAALTAAVTVQVAPNEAPAAGDWKTLQSSGTDVAIPAGKAVVIAAAFKALRVQSAGAEGAQRDFVILGQIDTSE